MSEVEKIATHVGIHVLTKPAVQKSIVAAATTVATAAAPVAIPVVVAVAPIALVGGAGYGIYRLFKWGYDQI